MKKIVRQQNYLRELIDSQGNRYISRHTLRCLVRSVLEPLLDNPETGVVLHRINNREGLQGLLKRLEFSEIESYGYNDDSENLLEKVWANSEFLCVLSHRYVVILIWDSNTGNRDTVRFYSLFNSKFQTEPLDIIRRNSKVDIAPFMEKFTPDRRDNALLNNSIRKLLSNMEEAASDAVLGYAEKNAETLTDSDYAQKKSGIVAHEIKNQLSICDLYTEIIRKHTDKDIVDRDAVLSAVSAINKALKMAGNCLLSLKTKGNTELSSVSLKEAVSDAAELSRVYLENKGIDFQIETGEDVNLLADKEKLVAIIINLVKNASEAFGGGEAEDNCPDENGKYIKIKTEKNEDCALIMVSNNAEGIEEPEKIFDEGFTTKSSGSGLGLWICRKTAEEQGGELTLSRSSEDYTEFTVRLGLYGG